MIERKWQPMKTCSVAGLQGERLQAWRDHRLWFIAESGYLIDGFEKRPGEHAWQGEHLGKWLHAATLAFQMTGDERLKDAMRSFVDRLLATQLDDGYLGTYEPDCTFMAMPENVPLHTAHDDMDTPRKPDAKITGWDTWTHRYNLYGLLCYEKLFPDEKIVDACKRMADLLIEVYGEGKYDLTKYGTRTGVSASTLLESIVMLYERTLDQRYLDFIGHMIDQMENNPRMNLMSTMLAHGTVVHPGEGKAYQLMAVMLGFLRLYHCTGNQDYLDTAVNGWHEIKEKHLLVTGGPWSRKTDYNANCECFAHEEAFNPEAISVEGCCDTTWIQLCLHLFETTGEATYMDEAEVTLFNSLYGHQHADGVKWCYYTAPNQADLPYTDYFQCCHSSMPRALEMMAANQVGVYGRQLSIATLSPSTVKLTQQFGGGTIVIESNYPNNAAATLRFETESTETYSLEFRLPSATSLRRVTINGEAVDAAMNRRGFFELNRAWESGDVLEIIGEYELQAKTQAGEDGKSWIAFRSGPVALAQKINEPSELEPFTGTPVDEAIDKLKRRTGISYAVEGTDVDLIPYWETCSDESGPKTYWRIH